MNLKCLVASFLAGLAIAGSAQATLVVGNLSRADGSEIIEDSLNNRHWLGWDVTKGLTYAQTVLATQAGGQFAGFSIARNLDAQLFITSMLGTTPCTSVNSLECAFDANPIWENLVGESDLDFRTGNNGFDSDLVWFLSDNNTGREKGFIQVVTFDGIGGRSVVSKENEYLGVEDATRYASTGWLLYKEAPSAVPEPAPIALLGIGLLGLLATRRKSKKGQLPVQPGTKPSSI